MTRFTARLALALWVAGLIACVIIVGRLRIGADLSAFLPRHPTPEQSLLADQLRDGAVSRLILVGIEGGDEAARAQVSRAMAQALRGGAEFIAVDNGDESAYAADFALLREHRYALSPAVAPARFTPEGLRAALEADLQALGGPMGGLVKQFIARDPTGELLGLIEGYANQARPAMRAGVWASADGQRAVLLLQTAAAGYDIDAQQRALARIDAAFAQARAGAAGAASGAATDLRLLVSGPAVFAVHARATIEGAATRLSMLTTVLIGALTLFAYRSVRVVALSMVPVASGALAGIAAVQFSDGVVYGVTLGFGITLIGEAIDYAVYFFARLTRERHPSLALAGIWPTLRLGVLTSICGFAAMLFGGFPGIAQLGLFSIVGLIVAILVTRWVLPSLVPAGFAAPGIPTFVPMVRAALARAGAWRPWVLAVIGLAAVSIAFHRGPLWNDHLSSLSPVSAADQALDGALRADLGAPDVRHLIIVAGGNDQQALERAEAVGQALAPLVAEGALGGVTSPAQALPSERVQRERLAALPAPALARERMAQALGGLPFKPEAFEPFYADLAAARLATPLARADLRGTHFAQQVDSLLVDRGDQVLAVLPLRGVRDPARIEQALATSGLAGQRADAVLLDLSAQSDALYATYLHEVLRLALAGAAAIVVLLALSLRSLVRALRVLLPVTGAVVVTLAIVLASGQTLLLFHLIGVLLAVAIGSNYALFFDRGRREAASVDADEEDRTMVSLVFATVSTVIAFGMLSISGVPVLSAIGETVALGACLSLVFSAVLFGRHAPAAIAQEHV